ncbi:MAG: acetyl-CoA C-acyltransferase [Thermoflavifilum sp.]|nr:MAG: acetyl-CoA C-acyltransferase [Thermoflavifilum sp.]
MQRDVFIVGAARTPIGSFQGALASVPATTLGAIAIREALQRAGLSADQVDEVFLGNVLQAALGQAPATQASLRAGIPDTVPATLVNKVCASGMKAIMLGALSIQANDEHVVVTGGMENMSQTPYYLTRARNGYRLGHGELLDGMILDGLWDPYHQCHMGNAAELCARTYHLTREQQDAYARQSYERVARAYAGGWMQTQLVPVEVQDGKNTRVVNEDEEFRRANFEKMPRLKPAFEEGGTITAANASKINDGAAAVILASEEAVKQWHLQPQARIVSFADAAQAPEWFTTTPIKAMNRALQKAGLKIQDMDFVEINEAFSCVAMVNAREMGIPEEKLNVWGGAVALGHPLGCSGARIVVTLLHILLHHQARYGLAGICNGGGGASAMIIENLMR